MESPADPPATKTTHVVVTDVDISFSNLVGLMVKCVFAAIPAAIIVAFVVAAMGVAFSSLMK